MSLLRVGLILKAIDALLEVAGGVMLFRPHDFSRWVVLLFQHDLIRRHAHPHTVAVLQNHATRAIYGASLAAALYLIAHGIIKVIFIVGVFKQKRWGYIGLIAVLLIFTAIELIHAFIAGGGVAIFLFALFDAFLAYLVWAEFRKEQPSKTGSKNPQMLEGPGRPSKLHRFSS
jgi:uncharacterized membrane protein